jgi:hypothetical protein
VHVSAVSQHGVESDDSAPRAARTYAVPTCASPRHVLAARAERPRMRRREPSCGVRETCRPLPRCSIKSQRPPTPGARSRPRQPGWPRAHVRLRRFERASGDGEGWGRARPRPSASRAPDAIWRIRSPPCRPMFHVEPTSDMRVEQHGSDAFIHPRGGLGRHSAATPLQQASGRGQAGAGADADGSAGVRACACACPDARAPGRWSMEGSDRRWTGRDRWPGSGARRRGLAGAAPALVIDHRSVLEIRQRGTSRHEGRRRVRTAAESVPAGEKGTAQRFTWNQPTESAAIPREVGHHAGRGSNPTDRSQRQPGAASCQRCAEATTCRPAPGCPDTVLVDARVPFHVKHRAPDRRIRGALAVETSLVGARQEDAGHARRPPRFGPSLATLWCATWLRAGWTLCQAAVR